MIKFHFKSTEIGVQSKKNVLLLNVIFEFDTLSELN